MPCIIIADKSNANFAIWSTILVSIIDNYYLIDTREDNM